MADRPSLIAAALTAELAPVCRRLGLQAESGKPPGAWRGAYVDRRVIAAPTGAGRERAAESIRSLIERYTPGRVLIVGTAGAADPALRSGQVLIPAIVLDEATGQRLAPTLETDTAGTLCTAAGLVGSPAQKLRLFRELGATAVDMETAAMAEVCDQHGVPWLCVRCVLDAADECLPDWLLRLTHPDGRANLPAAARCMILRPWRTALLLSLAVRTRRGMSAVAEQLRTLL